jgi:hypothetical protein
MLTVHSLRPEFRVQLVQSLEPVIADVDALARIHEIWEAESARRGGALFNGRLFSIVHSSPERITGWLTEYRWFLAQRRDPSLHPLLKVRPLGVTGVLCCGDGIVFGRRAGHVEMDASLWELVPSGGVDGSKVDVASQLDLGAYLLTELKEETGIQPTAVSRPPQAFAMVEDQVSHVTDVGLIIQVDYSAAQVHDLFAALTNREYVELEVVPLPRIPDFLVQCGATLAEVSRALLHNVMPRFRPES